MEKALADKRNKFTGKKHCLMISQNFHISILNENFSLNSLYQTIFTSLSMHSKQGIKLPTGGIEQRSEFHLLPPQSLS